MVKRYIEADTTYEVLTEYYHHKTEVQHEVLREALDRVPAADVQEVRRGHWEKVDDNPYEYVAACSVCRNEVKQPTCMLKPIYSYCPICGASMKGEKE